MLNQIPVIVCAKNKLYVDIAQRLAVQLKLDYRQQPTSELDVIILSVGETLSLLYQGMKFEHSISPFRIKRSKSEAVVSICNVNKSKVRILDATAGLGVDSCMLAAAGAEVMALEKHSVIYLLAKNTLDKIDLQTGSIHLEKRDSISYMQQHHKSFDIVYLDPMFGQTQERKSKSRKSMQILDRLIPFDINEQEMLSAACLCARDRVVIKRSLTAPYFAEHKPSWQHKGKSVRFDVLLVQ